MNRRAKQKAAIGFNGLIIVFEIAGLMMSVREFGVKVFQFYTQDSNYLALAASVFYEIFAVREWKGKDPIPRWSLTLRYMAACCLTLTFVIVLFVLIPMYGFKSAPSMLFRGTMLYHHLFCPLLSGISFLFFEEAVKPNKMEIYISIAPTVLYAIIMILLNIARVLNGPYPFLHVYEQPVWVSVIWVLVILGAALLFSWLLWIGKRKAQSGQGRTQDRINNSF